MVYYFDDPDYPDYEERFRDDWEVMMEDLRADADWEYEYHEGEWEYYEDLKRELCDYEYEYDPRDYW